MRIKTNNCKCSKKDQKLKSINDQYETQYCTNCFQVTEYNEIKKKKKNEKIS